MPGAAGEGDGLSESGEAVPARRPEVGRRAPPGGGGRGVQGGLRGESVPVPWTWRQTVTGTCLTLIPLVALLLISQTGPHQAVQSSPLPPAVDRLQAVALGVTSALVEAVFLIAPLYFAFKSRDPGADWRSAMRALGFRTFAPWPTIALITGGFALVYIFGLFYEQLHIQTNADRLAQQAAHAPYTTMAVLAVAVVVAPVCEELFFRGFVFGGSLRAMPVWAAAVVTAVLWGTAHVDPSSFIPLLVLGIVLAGLRWRSGSLWPGIALHALNNGVAAAYILVTLHR